MVDHRRSVIVGFGSMLKYVDFIEFVVSEILRFFIRDPRPLSSEGGYQNMSWSPAPI